MLIVEELSNALADLCAPSLVPRHAPGLRPEQRLSCLAINGFRWCQAGISQLVEPLKHKRSVARVDDSVLGGVPNWRDEDSKLLGRWRSALPGHVVQLVENRLAEFRVLSN